MLVSIIIPVYNQEELIKRAIDSIPFEQDIEVLVIDDGSTDNTYEVLQGYVDNPKIKIFHIDENKGVGTARNIGLDNAQGTYIYMLDSDDYLITDNFVLVLKYLNGTDLVYYNYVENNEKTRWVKDENKILRCGQVKFMRRDFIGDLRYEEGRRFSEDWFFNLQLQEKNPTEFFTYITVFHYNYPRHRSLSYLKHHPDEQ